MVSARVGRVALTGALCRQGLLNSRSKAHVVTASVNTMRRRSVDWRVYVNPDEIKPRQGQPVPGRLLGSYDFPVGVDRVA